MNSPQAEESLWILVCLTKRIYKLGSCTLRYMRIHLVLYSGSDLLPSPFLKLKKQDAQQLPVFLSPWTALRQIYFRLEECFP